MELYVKKAYHGDSRELFAELSSLDRLCVGTEGWSADSFESEAAKDNGIANINLNRASLRAICQLKSDIVPMVLFATRNIVKFISVIAKRED